MKRKFCAQLRTQNHYRKCEETHFPTTDSLITYATSPYVTYTGLYLVITPQQDTPQHEQVTPPQLQA